MCGSAGLIGCDCLCFVKTKSDALVARESHYINMMASRWAKEEVVSFFEMGPCGFQVWNQSLAQGQGNEVLIVTWKILVATTDAVP